MRPGPGLPSLSRRSRILLVIALLLGGLLLLGPRLVDKYTDWLWFGEVGYRSVFTTILLTRLLLFLVTGVAFGLIVWGAIVLAYRSRPVFVPAAGPNDPVARYRATVMSRRKLFGIGLPVLLGFFAGLVAQSGWVLVQMFLHSKSFGVADPQFGLDISFYAMDLPFYRFVLNWLFAVVLLAFAANLVTHYLFGGLRLAGRENALSGAARVQLAVLAGIFVLLKAVAYWFDRYELLFSDRKMPTFYGANYTDINAVLPAKMILLAIAVICAIAFFAGIVLRDLRIPALSAALLVLSSILVGAAWPLVVEQFSVKPNAADKEKPYILRNIEATRAAYGITADNVEYQDYKGSGTKNWMESRADVTTIANARLLDPNVLNKTFTQQRQSQNVYGFPRNLDIDRYKIGGKLQDYVVAARELSPSNLRGNQADWINRHTVYTHGNGMVMAPANRVNAEPARDANAVNSNSGYPDYGLSPIEQGTVKISQPRVYFGEVIADADPDYALVSGRNSPDKREYDSPTERYTYQGAGGVPIGGWLNRLAFAAKYGERNLLLSSVIGDDSKIIFNRDPRERVQKVAPWLTTDTDTYPAVVDGKIVWIVDAYTTLENYPYAQRDSLEGLVTDSLNRADGVPRKEVSYIRNSVKATVDAYDGTVSLYQVDNKDPVLEAWKSVFPGTVKPESEVSADLRAHFRYPEDLFKVQRKMIAHYHVDNPVDFFNGNSFWSVPNDPTAGPSNSALQQPPYYVLLGDAKTGEPTFNLTSPLTGFNREFLSAYVSVRSDPDGYGKFTVRKLPTTVQTQGPGQAFTAMTTSTRVATETGMIRGQGNNNQIVFGNLLTVPIADGGVLYIEPMYQERTGADASYPQLTRIIASYADGSSVRIGYAATLGEVLEQIFGPGYGRAATASGPQQPAPANPDNPPGQPQPNPGQPGTSPPPAPPQPGAAGRDAAVKEISQALEAVKTAQRSGSFTDLGGALDRLQKAIEAYEKLPK